mgnify:CR=1 FL=1
MQFSSLLSLCDEKVARPNLQPSEPLTNRTPHLDTFQVDEIWGGFTAPEPDLNDDFKEYKDTAGRQFLVIARSASLLMMRTPEHEIKQSKDPDVFSIYQAEPAYYNFSNFFEVGSGFYR